MPFELSDPKINRTGRPAGSMNKITRISLEVREALSEIVFSNTLQLKEDLESLPAELRVKYFIEICKFVLPQQKSVNYKNEEQIFNESPPDIKVTIFK